MDPNDFRKMGHEMVECIAKYMETIHDMPVVPDVRPGFLLKQLPSSAPEEAEDWEDIYADVNKLILPGVGVYCKLFFSCISFTLRVCLKFKHVANLYLKTKGLVNIFKVLYRLGGKGLGFKRVST